MTIEGRRKINFGLKTETREIPPGESVILSRRKLTGFRVLDPDTIGKGFGFSILRPVSVITNTLRRDQINAQKLREADHLSIKDRLLGRGHEIYRWRP